RASAPRSSGASWSVPTCSRTATTTPTTCRRKSCGGSSPTTSAPPSRRWTSSPPRSAPPWPGPSASGWTIRYATTLPTPSRCRPRSPACRACRCRPASARAAGPWACSSSAAGSTRRACWASPAASSGTPTGTGGIRERPHESDQPSFRCLRRSPGRPADRRPRARPRPARLPGARRAGRLRHRRRPGRRRPRRHADHRPAHRAGRALQPAGRGGLRRDRRARRHEQPGARAPLVRSRRQARRRPLQRGRLPAGGVAPAHRGARARRLGLQAHGLAGSGRGHDGPCGLRALVQPAHDLRQGMAGDVRPAHRRLRETGLRAGIRMQWEVVIGLETHVQLATRSKIFSGASTAFGAAPNTQASAVDLALPGVLPVLNREAVAHAIRFGLAVDATVAPMSVFARKNYFYPDLPKGYQISQYAIPVVQGGHLDIDWEADGERLHKRIRLTRAHLEEDAGKSLHDAFEGMSGIDLNRAGTPLLEIVTEPDMRSAKEAVAYARSLHALVVWLGISDDNLQEGSFRCDANVSVRPLGQEAFGTRAEIKNLNSFRFLERAIEFEVRRQVELIEDGGTVVQETRL